jgi:hypothetical protein
MSRQKKWSRIESTENGAGRSLQNTVRTEAHPSIVNRRDWSGPLAGQRPACNELAGPPWVCGLGPAHLGRVPRGYGGDNWCGAPDPYWSARDPVPWSASVHWATISWWAGAGIAGSVRAAESCLHFVSTRLDFCESWDAGTPCQARKTRSSQSIGPGVPVKPRWDRLTAAEFAGRRSILRGAVVTMAGPSCCSVRLFRRACGVTISKPMGIWMMPKGWRSSCQEYLGGLKSCRGPPDG